MLRKFCPHLMLAAGLASVFTLSACVNGSLTPTAQADLTEALALACPIYAQLKANPPKMNATQTTAFNSLASFCPPNPAPTTSTALASDVTSALAILAPLIKV